MWGAVWSAGPFDHTSGCRVAQTFLFPAADLPCGCFIFARVSAFRLSASSPTNNFFTTCGATTQQLSHSFRHAALGRRSAIVAARRRIRAGSPAWAGRRKLGEATTRWALSAHESHLQHNDHGQRERHRQVLIPTQVGGDVRGTRNRRRPSRPGATRPRVQTTNGFKSPPPASVHPSTDSSIQLIYRPREDDAASLHETLTFPCSNFSFSFSSGAR